MSKKEVRWDLVLKAGAAMVIVIFMTTVLVGLPYFKLGNDAPAWAQFYGSILAILGAAAFPYIHERATRRQRAESYRELLSLLAGRQVLQIQNLIVALERAPETLEASIHAYLDTGEHLVWQPHFEALRAVPIVELAPLHVMALGDLKVGSEFVGSVVSRLGNWDVCGAREIANIERLRHFKMNAEINAEALEVRRY